MLKVNKLVALGTKFNLRRSISVKTTDITQPEKIPLAYYSYDPKYLITDELNPVIILHSLYTSKNYFYNLAPEISKNLLRPVYLVDLKNHGESAHRPFDGRAALMLAVHDVANFIDDLQLKKVMMIGYGFGARVAIQMSQTNPNRVERVVAIDLSQDGTAMFSKTFPNFLCYLHDLKVKESEGSLRAAKLTMKEVLRGQVRNQMTLKYILENIQLGRDQVFKWKFNRLTLDMMLRKWPEVMRISYSGKSTFDGEVLNIVTKDSYLTSEDYLDMKSGFVKHKVEYLNTRFLINSRGGNLMRTLKDFSTNSSD